MTDNCPPTQGRLTLARDSQFHYPGTTRIYPDPASPEAGYREEHASMSQMTVNVCLYGALAEYAGGRHVAQFNVQLEPGSDKADLLAMIGIPEQERGYLFINAVLCEVPGLTTGRGESLRDGDHIGIFSTSHVWPYQYRDGIVMSESLKELMRQHGAMHHSYKNVREAEK